MTGLLCSMTAAGAIVLGVVAIESQQVVPRWGIVAFLGDASYSIYLSHDLTLGVLKRYWSRSGLIDGAATHAMAFAFTGLTAAMLCGCGIYWLVEKPLHVRLSALFATSGHAQPVRTVEA